MVVVPPPPVIAVLTRAPSRGGKTRLFAALSHPPDPQLLSALLLDTLDGVRLPDLPCVVAVEPGDACDEVHALVDASVRVVPQGDGSLGSRMRSTMTALLQQGASGVLLVGSDLPDMRSTTVAAAASHLQHDPGSLVLGPTHDGGYYLIGATFVPDVFDCIDWGSSRVLAQTLEAAAACGLRVHLLPVMSDVDTPEDLWSVRARRTRAWVELRLSNR